MGFLVDLWDNQPATVIGVGVVIAVLLGIYTFLLNKYKQFLNWKLILRVGVFLYWSNGLFNRIYLVVIANDAVSKAMQGITYERP